MQVREWHNKAFFLRVCVCTGAIPDTKVILECYNGQIKLLKRKLSVGSE